MRKQRVSRIYENAAERSRIFFFSISGHAKLQEKRSMMDNETIACCQLSRVFGYNPTAGRKLILARSHTDGRILGDPVKHAAKIQKILRRRMDQRAVAVFDLVLRDAALRMKPVRSGFSPAKLRTNAAASRMTPRERAGFGSR